MLKILVILKKYDMIKNGIETEVFDKCLWMFLFACVVLCIVFVFFCFDKLSVCFGLLSLFVVLFVVFCLCLTVCVSGVLLSELFGSACWCSVCSCCRFFGVHLLCGRAVFFACFFCALAFLLRVCL